jgi:hypothetical protein
VSRDGEQRFLHRNPARGYSDTPYLGAPGEPEAISEQEQVAQTLAARRRWEKEQRRAWGTARQHIFAAVESFRRDGHPGRAVDSDLRVLSRVVAKVDRRVGL